MSWKHVVVDQPPLGHLVDEHGATVFQGTGPGGFATVETRVPDAAVNHPKSDWLVGCLTGLLAWDATSDDHLLAKLDLYFSLRQYLEATGEVLDDEWDAIARSALERAAAWRRDPDLPTNDRESWGPPPLDERRTWADCGLAAVGNNNEREEK